MPGEKLLEAAESGQFLREQNSYIARLLTEERHKNKKLEVRVAELERLLGERVVQVFELRETVEELQDEVMDLKGVK